MSGLPSVRDPMDSPVNLDSSSGLGLSESLSGWGVSDVLPFMTVVFSSFDDASAGFGTCPAIEASLDLIKPSMIGFSMETKLALTFDTGLLLETPLRTLSAPGDRPLMLDEGVPVSSPLVSNIAFKFRTLLGAGGDGICSDICPADVKTARGQLL